MQQLERFQPRTHRFFRIMVPWYVSKISSHIFPIFPCLLLESHSLLYSSSYLSSSMETAHQLHHHHHHHHQRSWCPAQGAALVPCIEPTFPNSSSDKILTKESFELSFDYNFRLGHNTLNSYFYTCRRTHTKISFLRTKGGTKRDLISQTVLLFRRRDDDDDFENTTI